MVAIIFSAHNHGANSREPSSSPFSEPSVSSPATIQVWFGSDKILVHSSFESHNLIGPDEVIDFP